MADVVHREVCLNGHDVAEVGFRVDGKGHRRCNGCRELQNARKRRPKRTKCAKGHSFTKYNTITWTDRKTGRVQRKCRTCENARAAKRRKAAR